MAERSSHSDGLFLSCHVLQSHSSLPFKLPNLIGNLAINDLQIITITAETMKDVLSNTTRPFSFLGNNVLASAEPGCKMHKTTIIFGRTVSTRRSRQPKQPCEQVGRAMRRKPNKYTKRIWPLLLGWLLLVAPEAYSQYTYVTNAGAITITGYIGTGGTVNLPSTINGHPVTGIQFSTFQNNDNVTNLTIPDSVTFIGVQAFLGSSALISVTIGHGVASIPRLAFEGCSSLTGITIPNNVTDLGDAAFDGCSKLTNVTIPASVITMGAAVFANCFNLTNIAADPANPAYGSVSGVLFDKSGSTLIEYPDGKLASSYSIPSGVTSIGSDAFFDCRLTAVTIPEGVTNIGVSAFEGCNLTNVDLPDSVVSLKLGAFLYCRNMVSVNLPNGVTTISTNAFFGCDSLDSVTIPGSVTNIGPGAFANCGDLTALNVDSSNPAYASVGGVLFNKSMTTLIDYPAGNHSTSYAVPSGVRAIQDNAFNTSVWLTSVTIPGSVATIGQDAFAFCSSLTNLTIPDSVTNLGDYVFSSCTALSSLTIGSGLTSIPYLAFAYCSRLTSVTIPASVTTLGDSSFAVSGLTNITIPASVTTIYGQPFGYCASLTTISVNPQNTSFASLNGVVFDRNQTSLVAYPAGAPASIYVVPNTVTNIEAESFEGSANLTSVIVPPGVANVGELAFVDCINLTGAYFEGNASGVDGTAGSGDSSVFEEDASATVYYLAGSSGWNSTFGGAPTMALPGIAIAANPSNGAVPLTVQCTSAGTDSNTNAITNWTWDFGDSSTSTVQNPSHTYATPGIFPVALFETNMEGVPLAGAATSVIAGFNSGLAVNGSFETGDFTGWALTGGANRAFVDDGSYLGTTPYSGNHYAALTTAGAVGNISQTISTTPGAKYLLSFWLANPDGDPAEFLVSWNGNILLDTTNFDSVGWTKMQFVVSATSTGTILQFGFEDNYSALALDAVNVETNFVQFAAAPTSGLLPLTVHFTSPTADNEGNTITSWHWDFGDGNTSVLQNPAHVYSGAGVFGPQLVTTNSLGVAVLGVGPAEIACASILSLYNFSTTSNSPPYGNSDGATPYSGLVLSGDTLYGAAYLGGKNGNGTIFRLNADGSNFTNLYNFTALDTIQGTNNGGAEPAGALILLSNTLFGTAFTGGSADCGTVFAVNTDGTGFTTLYNFTNGADGANPMAGLVAQSNILYGTAAYGGDSGWGTVFAISADGSGFTNLYSFTAPSTTGTNSDGAYPQNGLILSNNVLYGTAANGGPAGRGTVFAVNTDGTAFTTLYGFTNSVDGANPGSLVLSGSIFYGTTYGGGANGNGTVFAVNTNGTGFTNLYSFTQVQHYTNSEGANPGMLVISGNTLYGTAFGGGRTGSGTVFAIKTNGTGFTNLYSFTDGADGSNPIGLVLSGAVLYGTTEYGGNSGNGAVFALGLSGETIPAMQPHFANVNLSGSNLVLTGINGQFGGTYYLLEGTNLALPLSQWTRVATNVLSAGGNFTITATNTVNNTVPGRFYILQEQ